MSRVADAVTDGPAAAVVAGAFVLLGAAAWFVSPGVSVALACYGAALVSGRVRHLVGLPSTRLRRSLALASIALAWLIVLAFAALTLPSNFSAAVI
jgi:hypothetical protein